jgi:hypothetical protein
MTQPKQSQKPEEKNDNPPGLPKTIAVYERPSSKKVSIALMITLGVIILLSVLAFWLLPALF